MASKRSKATLSKGRNSWCVIFRHPVCMASDGKQKLRVRRGLGTADELVAQRLVDELNAIIDDGSLWNLASRELAAQRFSRVAVSAFFDPMTPILRDNWSVRDGVLPLPGGKDSTDGYIRVMFVGTTGAGKTTVIRQIIGTDPELERFPSISAARTTTCDMEIILADGFMRAVVTFFPRELVRQYIVECTVAAVLTKMSGAADNEVYRRLLVHGEQRFRLSYLLGDPLVLERSQEDELEDETALDDEAQEDEASFNETERASLLGTLRNYMQQIAAMAISSLAEQEKIVGELGLNLVEATKDEREFVQELVEDELVQTDEFQSFVDTLLDDVESRFELLVAGELTTGRDGWPLSWTYESNERPDFIREVTRFSSNYARKFGQLLTPLVDGIRVSGPFGPEWYEGQRPRLVLMDGQGIGHTADSTTSLSTSITKRFNTVDAIVLADNAAQPMQAGPCKVLESLVTSGHESKLVLAFTHFDEVKGDNLTGAATKKNHVISSFENVLRVIGRDYGREAEAALRRAISDRVVFLSNVQMRVPESAKLTRSELQRLLAAFEACRPTIQTTDLAPVYDVANLVLAVQKAAQEFHERWDGLLGMGNISGTRPEHWTRIKALTRRLAEFGRDEYDTLRPVADLIAYLQKHVSVFLASPIDWHPAVPAEDDEVRIRVIDDIRKEVFTQLHEISRLRLMDERTREWMAAYNYRGTGSTRLRAREIDGIYTAAAPVPNEMPGPDANEFLFLLRKLVADAVIASGGKLKSWSPND